jgi:FolB domain-containing protein
MPSSQPTIVDIAILGGGPAGCSAASWLAQLGQSVALIERAPELCASLTPLAYAQGWVLGEPGQTLADVGRRYAAHIAEERSVSVFTAQTASSIDWQAGVWHLQLAEQAVQARSLLIATGLRPRRPSLFFPAEGFGRVMDALTLTARRDALPRGRILLLGGGDNAVENALHLKRLGHTVTIWSRSDWRAQTHFTNQLAADSSIVQRPATPLPRSVQATNDGVRVHSAAFGEEHFDHVAVLLGYEPTPEAWQLAADALQRAGINTQRFVEDPAHGLFVAGDANQRQHPSVQTALGDGVNAAKRIETFLRNGPEAAPRPRNERQVIHIIGLRIGANLGILDFEREGPQPIQVDAEINLGPQALVSRDSDIGHVLDYRRIRQIIIDECTAEHTDILEALVAKLCTRLMKLPGVKGIRVKVNKLEIFPDCQVAISAETGNW